MAYQSNNVQSPAAEYLYKLQMIVSNSEFKNNELANSYETTETKLAGDRYVNAVLGKDSFYTYNFTDIDIYNALLHSGYPEEDIYKCIKNPALIPTSIKYKMLIDGRANYIATYVEMNKYYCNLTGKPFTGNDDIPPDRIVTVPDEFYELYSSDGVVKDQPIHTMSPEFQEVFMNTKYYDQILKEYPDVTYLKYIGSNAIPLEVSRRSMDGEILRINTDKLSGWHRKFGNVSVSNDIVHLFTNVYKQTRDYVYNTLRGNFSSIYPNYNNLIRFLTIYMAIGQSLNELMKRSSSMSYLNNASANNYFMLYGLPSVIMEGQSMINFLKKFRLLLMDKGTSTVYRVKDFVGYKYTDIYTLVMVKQQVFENGLPKYIYDEDGNKTPVYNVVFRRLGTSDDKTSYFKFRDSRVEYDWKEIASGDPRWWWWNDPDIDAMLYEMNYTLSNSKYIQLSTHMSMNDIFWQSVIFLRGLLDSRRETQFSKISINYDIGENSSLTVFDAVLVLVILMNWNMNMINGKSFAGKLYYNNGEYNGVEACLDLLFNGLKDDGSPEDLKLGNPFKVASFNFDVRTQNIEFYKELPSYDYLEPDIFVGMLDKVLDSVTKNTGEMMMNNVRAIYNYLVDKLLKSRTIHEFRQVAETYKNLFLVNPVRDKWYDDENVSVVTLLAEKYQISETDIQSLQRFCFDHDDNPPFVVQYDDINYVVNIGTVLNYDVRTYEINGIYPFLDSDFVQEFYKAMDSYSSNIIPNSNLPNSVKNNYRGIIKDKVTYELNTGKNGPETFESLLLLQNPSLYNRLMSMKSDGTNLIFLMRAIIKGLETYSSSELSALEFAAIGETEYINILKEVIGYFKSYMVEYTKDEFVYVMDGLFDNGGNSNMLRLYDEITNLGVNMVVPDSVTLFDVSNSEIQQQWKDENIFGMYDEAVIRGVMSYAYAKTFGYDIWFNNGSRVTKNEPAGITDDTEVTATFGHNIIIIDTSNLR